MEPQRPGQSRRDAAAPQIGLGDRARYGLRQGVQTRRSGRCSGLPFKEGTFGLPGNDGIAEKAPGFIERCLKAGEASGEADEVEEIAILPASGVQPFSPALTPEADEHALAGGAVNVAHDPIIPAASAAGQVGGAHRLGLVGEAARKVRGVVHCASPSSAPPDKGGCFKKSRDRASTPSLCSAGANRRSRHWMISPKKPILFRRSTS